MKKILASVMALSLALLLSACDSFVSIMPGTELEPSAVMTAAQPAEDGFEVRSVLDFLGRQAFAESYYSDTPVALSCQRDTAEGEQGCRAYVFDRTSIIAACDALQEMTVVGRAEEEPVRTEEYILTMENGDEYDFRLGVLADGSTHVLSSYTGEYVVSGGDALWDIPFPAYSQDFDVFDLYFSDSVRAFADDFYQNTPVSVGYRMNSGATITSTDPEAVAAAFEALSAMSVIVVENQPDQNVDLAQARDYIFTMEDGTYYTFSFAQRCLSVTANPGFGPVYYWLNGVDALWNVEIASENRNGKFEGGPVADLRDDIRRAADIVIGEPAETEETLETEESEETEETIETEETEEAEETESVEEPEETEETETEESGETAELSVLGVFVEYDIDGRTGYLTLDGDTAVDFIRSAFEVNVSAETEENPEGDKITVSITLSDSSGPILYFTGDTIQQVVGINYICDSGDMSALRSQVLELSGDSSNTDAEVEDGGTD